jgi:peptidoglycan/xylan/chitin deacetylase (PgdA/CDA1 family)
MHHDCQLYYAPSDSTTWVETNTANSPSTWMKPMTPLIPSSIVEVPANWHLDDWPPLNLNLKQPSTHGYVDTRSIEQLWKDQFEFYYREYDTFVFPISIHPQVSGKPQVILMHERIIEWINGHEGVEWMTMEEMVREFKEGSIGGVEVKGGVDAGL